MNFIQKVFNGLEWKDLVPPLFYKLRSKFENVTGRRVGTARRLHYARMPDEVSPAWVVDVGAADGAMARAALDSYPSCKVVCFEPCASTFTEMKNALSRYGERVRLIHAAVADYTGETQLHITTSRFANSLFPQSEKYKEENPAIHEISSETVHVVSLDSLDLDLPPRSDGILKIDVEGSEMEVLLGGRKFISGKVDWIIIELAFARRTGDFFLRILNLLDEYGFEIANIIDMSQSGWNQCYVCSLDAVFRRKKRVPAEDK
ncbi:MAG: hypothetical protein BWY31_01133 [Lentisphaerae bacterium ADurb.Bin242]|nr:MAG: hypothetical protein BWY31_01133 [Lentisphaerae bacterium ADurb.Bin242]